jgi:DNA invertase Pin-like site-specific DNA recombinase
MSEKTTKTKNKNLIIYSRISCEKTIREDASIETQIALGENYAKSNGYNVLGTFSEIASGGKDDREELAGAIEMAKTAGATIWFYSLSRFSRSLIHSLKWFEEFKKLGIKFVSHSEKADVETAAGIFQTQMICSVGEYARNVTAERTRETLANLKNNGKKYTRKTPYGFRLSKDKKHFRKSVKEQRVIRRMQNLREEGCSFQLIANILNDERIKPREGGEWVKSAVFYIIKRACETTPQTA